jgi:hypothetical protein
MAIARAKTLRPKDPDLSRDFPQGRCGEPRASRRADVERPRQGRISLYALFKDRIWRLGSRDG